MKYLSPTKQERFDLVVDRVCRWHKWFAWHPVRIYDEHAGTHFKVWMQYVGRRKSLCSEHNEYGGYSDKICRSEYCYEEDLIVRVLKDPDIKDVREDRKAPPFKKAKATSGPNP